LAGSIEGGDVLGEEIVEHGADGGDDGELGDVLPSRRHRGAHKIRGERELKREQDPSGKFEPDLAPRISSAVRVNTAPTSPVSACRAPKVTMSTAPASMASATNSAICLN
jgi:hypothetical protein